MKLLLIRRWFGPDKTISKLFVNGLFKYFVLEDLVRPEGDKKVYGQTAIPYGKFNVSVSQSPKLGRVLPLIENVPGFSGIRIHAGVDESWTEGCLLISKSIKGGNLVKDIDAEQELTSMVKSAVELGDPVTIKVTNSQKQTFIYFTITIVVLLSIYVIFRIFHK